MGRRAKVLLGVIGIGVALLAANVTGVLRYPGGPLRDSTADGPLWLDIRPANQGNNLVGLTSQANVGARAPIYIGVFPRNQWAWAATIERVRLINATSGLELVEARLALPGRTGDGVGVVVGPGPYVEELGILTDFRPLPADLAGDTPIQDGQMWVQVKSNQPGEYSFESVALDYRVGPFTFTVDMHQALTVCLVPLPEGVRCSIDSD